MRPEKNDGANVLWRKMGREGETPSFGFLGKAEEEQRGHVLLLRLK